MKTFTITVSGKTHSAVLDALEQLRGLIEWDDPASGFDRNEWGSFSFDSAGEYEDEEE